MTPYSREYTLKSGRTVTIRQPIESDAEALMALLERADHDSRFLVREPGEFDFTVESERELIAAQLVSETSRWFIAELDGELVGQCSAHVLGRKRRVCHRGGMGIVVRGDCWGMGIGGRLMLEAIAWCRAKGLEQLELEVVDGNERAIAMYEGFGFARVGTIPDAMKYADGTYAALHTMVLKL